jgi:hypothetical protein
MENFRILTTLGGHSHWVYSMILHNDLLLCGSHNMIKVWVFTAEGWQRLVCWFRLS